MRRVSVAIPTPEEIAALDRLASVLRTDKRQRVIAEGLPIQEAFCHFFAEQAGKTGGR